MVKTFIAFLLSGTLLFGQGFTMRDTAFLGASSSSGPFAPTDVSGMALYWNYLDLSAGTISTWTDRIQGINATQSGTKRPTKDANGVLFSIAANTSLTNVQQTGTSYSNCTIWVTFKLSVNTSGFSSLLSDDHDGSGLMFGSTQNGAVFYPRATILWTAATGVYYDWVFQYTNNAAANNKAWTNGVYTGINYAPFSTRFTGEAYIGNDTADEPFGGYIKFVGIWTNKWLTAAEIANIHTYSSTH